MNKALPKLPTRIDLYREIEIRRFGGVWSKWEGRVVSCWRYDVDAKDRIRTDHLYPCRRPAGLAWGWVPYWARGRSNVRLERRLRDWCRAQDREKVRLQPVIRSRV